MRCDVRKRNENAPTCLWSRKDNRYKQGFGQRIARQRRETEINTKTGQYIKETENRQSTD